MIELNSITEHGHRLMVNTAFTRKGDVLRNGSHRIVRWQRLRVIDHDEGNVVRRCPNVVQRVNMDRAELRNEYLGPLVTRFIVLIPKMWPFGSAQICEQQGVP